MKCPYCGFTFRVDPDDPSIYKVGRFDVLGTTQDFQTVISPEQTLFSSFKKFLFKNSSPDLYSTQNIKLVVGFVLLLLLFLNIWKIFFSNTNIPYQKEERIQLEKDGELPTDEKAPFQI